MTLIVQKMSYHFRRNEIMSDSCYRDGGNQREGSVADYRATPSNTCGVKLLLMVLLMTVKTALPLPSGVATGGFL